MCCLSTHPAAGPGGSARSATERGADSARRLFARRAPPLLPRLEPTLPSSRAPPPARDGGSIRGAFCWRVCSQQVHAETHPPSQGYPENPRTGTNTLHRTAHNSRRTYLGIPIGTACCFTHVHITTKPLCAFVCIHAYTYTIHTRSVQFSGTESELHSGQSSSDTTKSRRPC